MKRFRRHMFITSFLPLWLSIVVTIGWHLADIYFHRPNALCEPQNIAIFTFAVLVLAVSTMSTIYVIWFLNSIGQTGQGKIIRAEKAKRFILDFLVAYAMPLAVFDFASVRGIVLFLIYFVVIASVSLRNNNVYTNVLLDVLGYKMYICAIRFTGIDESSFERNNCVVVSKEAVFGSSDEKIDTSIAFCEFENEIFVNIKRENRRV